MPKQQDNSEPKEGYIKVQLDYAPSDEKAFKKWCEERGFDYLGSGGRGAWCSQLGTYFRGASGVAYYDGEMILFDEEDIVDLQKEVEKARDIAWVERDRSNTAHLFIGSPGASVHNPKLCPECIEPGSLTPSQQNKEKLTVAEKGDKVLVKNQTDPKHNGVRILGDDITIEEKE